MFQKLRRLQRKRELILDAEKKILNHDIDIEIIAQRNLPKIVETRSEAMKEVQKTVKALEKAKKDLKGKAIKPFELKAQQAQSYLEVINKAYKEAEAKMKQLVNMRKSYVLNIEFFKNFPF